METLKSKKEFQEVFSRGRRYGHPLVRVTVLRDCDEAAGKVAFVAARRLGNAVFRNRCKRVLREAARMCDLPAQDAAVILFATRRTHASTPAQVGEALRVLLAKAHVA